MEIRVTTLSENTATYGYIAEWGLSMLVEVDGMRILMDAGLSFSAVFNAQLLGIDLTTLHHIVLSHGHADHTGGLREVLKRAGPKKVVAHPDIGERKYVRHRDEPERYIGIPFAIEEFEALGAAFITTREPVKLSDRVMTTGEILMTTEYEDIDPDMYVGHGSERTHDGLADDLALVIDADFGLVIILGCAHRGVANTLCHACKLTGRKSVYAIVGGTHLFRASDERVDKTIAAFKEMGVQRLGVSHCTGFRASARLAQEFGNSFFLNNTGTRFTLP